MVELLLEACAQCRQGLGGGGGDDSRRTQEPCRHGPREPGLQGQARGRPTATPVAMRAQLRRGGQSPRAEPTGAASISG